MPPHFPYKQCWDHRNTVSSLVPKRGCLPWFILGTLPCPPENISTGMERKVPPVILLGCISPTPNSPPYCPRRSPRITFLSNLMGYGVGAHGKKVWIKGVPCGFTGATGKWGCWREPQGLAGFWNQARWPGGGEGGLERGFQTLRERKFYPRLLSLGFISR